jgi:hypothetical protein
MLYTGDRALEPIEALEHRQLETRVDTTDKLAEKVFLFLLWCLFSKFDVSNL